LSVSVYLRPLREIDAHTSWRWRNDPNIWAFTGSRPDKQITEEMELEWICRVLSDESSKRYAICLSDTDEYIGNVQLTDIKDGAAEFHIFIGEPTYWGKGIGKTATRELLKYAFFKLNLDTVYLVVKKENVGAIQVYLNSGFVIQGDKDGDYLMYCQREGWNGLIIS